MQKNRKKDQGTDLEGKETCGMKDDILKKNELRYLKNKKQCNEVSLCKWWKHRVCRNRNIWRVIFNGAGINYF